MKYAVFSELDRLFVCVVDAPKDDRHAIIDAARQMALDVSCADEDEYQMHLEHFCSQKGITLAEGERIIRDMGFEMYDGMLLNWNGLTFVPYPPTTEVGLYHKKRTWRPDYERFRS